MWMLSCVPCCMSNDMARTVALVAVLVILPLNCGRHKKDALDTVEQSQFLRILSIDFPLASSSTSLSR